MRVKADWRSYLHRQRRRELDIIFARCPARLFGSALEVGAGDGYQSTILSQYAVSLLCTDYHSDILRREPRASMRFRVCDAETIGETLGEREFDLVFSSNLLEHVSRPHKVLAGVQRVLVDHGVTIHVVPSPFWKLCHLALYMPNMLLVMFEEISERGLLTTLRRKLGRLRQTRAASEPPADRNNPKTD
jgi:ubiquinone/menaquinone biosynthesis C-methylase UbiE